MKSLALLFLILAPIAYAQDDCGPAAFHSVRTRIRQYCTAALYYRVDQAHYSPAEDRPALRARCNAELLAMAKLEASPKHSCANGLLNKPDDAYGNTQALFKTTVEPVIVRKLKAKAAITDWLEDCRGYDLEHDPSGVYQGAIGLQRYLNQFAFGRDVTPQSVCN
jgi:hypothetical protein